MLGYRALVNAIKQLGLSASVPVIVHAPVEDAQNDRPGSGDPLAEGIQGGLGTLLGALLACFSTVLMPAFTPQTMVIPEVAPEGSDATLNAIVYGSGRQTNLLAEIFHPKLLPDPSLGKLVPLLLKQPGARRSSHPILSFCGIRAEAFLSLQTIAEPLALVGGLAEAGGWAVFITTQPDWQGGLKSATALHWTERLAGREHFLRWALQREKVVECPHIPGCSQGFVALASRLENVIRRVQAEALLLWAVGLSDLVRIARDWLLEEPLAMLCGRDTCLSCLAVVTSYNRMQEEVAQRGVFIKGQPPAVGAQR